MIANDAILRCMVKASRLAGLQIRSAVLQRSSAISFKTKSNSSDLVTETDVQCQEIIVNTLMHEFPKHKIVGEESAEGSDFNFTNDETFIIDPIDGTSNFAKAIPHCAVLISHSTRKRIDRAVVLDPFRLELFYAVEGKGAYLSNLDAKSMEVLDTSSPRKLAVNSHIGSLREATILTDLGYTRDRIGVARFLELENQLLVANSCRAMRVLGSCGLGLAWVACGRADVYVEREGPVIWDFSGGDLLVREAGGLTLDPSGAEFDLTKRSVLAAASPRLAEQIVTCVKTADALVNKMNAKL